jgi:hypothetical protein
MDVISFCFHEITSIKNQPSQGSVKNPLSEEDIFCYYPQVPTIKQPVSVFRVQRGTFTAAFLIPTFTQLDE